MTNEQKNNNKKKNEGKMYCFPSLRVKWFLCNTFFCMLKKMVIEYRFDVVYKLNVDLSIGGMVLYF